MWQIKYWYHIIEWYAVLPKYTHNSYIPLGSPNFEAIFMKLDTREAGKYTDKIESYLSNNELDISKNYIEWQKKKRFLFLPSYQLSFRLAYAAGSILVRYFSIM